MDPEPERRWATIHIAHAERATRRRWVRLCTSWLMWLVIGVVWTLQPAISGPSLADWLFALVIGVPLLIWVLWRTPRALALLASRDHIRVEAAPEGLVVRNASNSWAIRWDAITDVRAELHRATLEVWIETEDGLETRARGLDRHGLVGLLVRRRARRDGVMLERETAAVLTDREEARAVDADRLRAIFVAFGAQPVSDIQL